VSQPVLSLQPARARSIGPSAGLLEGPGGGVVFIFGTGHYLSNVVAYTTMVSTTPAQAE